MWRRSNAIARFLWILKWVKSFIITLALNCYSCWVSFTDLTSKLLCAQCRESVTFSFTNCIGMFEISALKCYSVLLISRLSHGLTLPMGLGLYKWILVPLKSFSVVTLTQFLPYPVIFHIIYIMSYNNFIYIFVYMSQTTSHNKAFTETLNVFLSFLPPSSLFRRKERGPRFSLHSEWCTCLQKAEMVKNSFVFNGAEIHIT